MQRSNFRIMTRWLKAAAKPLWLAWGSVLVGILALVIIDALNPFAGITPSVESAEVEGGQVYLILPGDGGEHGIALGCGDSLIGYRIETGGGAAALKTTLAQLLSLPARPARPPGAYNALGRSSLRIVSLSVEKHVAHIALEGELRLRGHCDAIRAVAQLHWTVSQQPEIRDTYITISGRRMHDLLLAKR